MNNIEKIHLQTSIPQVPPSYIPGPKTLAIVALSATCGILAYEACRSLKAYCHRKMETHVKNYAADRLIVLLSKDDDLSDALKSEKERSVCIRDAFLNAFSDPQSIDDLCKKHQLSESHALILKAQGVALRNSLQPIIKTWHSWFRTKDNPKKEKIELTAIDFFILEKLIAGHILWTKPNKSPEEKQQVHKAFLRKKEIAKKVIKHFQKANGLSRKEIQRKIKSFWIHALSFIDSQEIAAKEKEISSSQTKRTHIFSFLLRTNS